VTVGQDVVLSLLREAPADPLRKLVTHGPYALLWALATPFVLRSARKWPVHGPNAFDHALRHMGVALLFLLVTNATLRLPLLADPALWLRDLLDGIATFGPWAVLAWGLLVAIGHAPWIDARPREVSVTHPQAEEEPAVVPAQETVPVPAPLSGELRCASNGRLTRIPPAEIEWVEAASNYVRVRTEKRTWLLREPLSDVEATLPAGEFVRIHRSTIVALRSVREIRPRSHGDATVILRDGTTFRVSRTRRAALTVALNGGAANGRH
jgi:hypothetical protein